MTQAKNFLFYLIACFLLFGCGAEINLSTSTESISSIIPPEYTLTLTPYINHTLTPTATILPQTPVPTPSLTPYPEPEGCLRPIDDMTRITVDGHFLNRRTIFMLQHAAELYGGTIDVAYEAITQGSYTDSEPLSFGTHAGGGAVDISVIKLPEWEVLWDDIEPLIYALRVAGFAAWLREYGELKPGSPIHIHAVAVGDPELSYAAREQLTGPYGYFLGYTGVPQDGGPPVPDRHGGPIMCQWMLEMGYQDLSQSP
jgi:hypothetical protein